MTHTFLPYKPYAPDDPHAAAEAFKQRMKQRRSIRDFSSAEVPERLIENLIETACSAPSGANKQPWHFVAICNGELKAKIRQAAEREEQLFYEERASETWLKDLEKLGTNANKPFLEDAPWLIVVFRCTQSDNAGQVYYSPRRPRVALRQGRGKFWYVNGDVYEGHWRRNLPHGQGRLIYTSGAVYEGAFVSGRRHGAGVLTYASGDVYEGAWNDDNKEGRGTFTFIESADEVAARMTALFTMLETPALTDVTLDWRGGHAETEAWPNPVPDLYLGEPVTILAALGDGTGSVDVTGRLGGKVWQTQVPVIHGQDRPGIAALWARQKIRGLEDRMRWAEDREAVKAVRSLLPARSLVSLRPTRKTVSAASWLHLRST